MRSLMPFLLLILSFHFVPAEPERDSLDLILESILDPKAKADTLCKIGWDIKFQDLGRAYEFFLEAESLSKANDYPWGVANAQNRLGSVYYMISDPDTAMMYYRSSLEIFLGLGDKEKIGALYLNVGNIFAFIGEADSSYTYTSKSLEIFREIGDKSGEAAALGNIGTYYQHRGVLKKAIDYYLKELAIEDSLGDESSKASTLNNIGTCFWNLYDYPHALENFKKATIIFEKENNVYFLASAYLNIGGAYQDMGDFDSARVYSKKALLLARQMGDITTESKVLNNLGIQYEKLGKLDSSEIFHKLAMEGYGAAGNLHSRISAIINLSSLYQVMGRYQEGLKLVDEGIDIALEIQDFRLLAKVYSNKANLLASVGRYKEAIQYYNLFEAGWDTIQSNQIIEISKELQVKYETEQKDLLIDNLNQENELKSALVEKKELELEQGRLLRNLLSVVAVLLIFAAAGFYRSFRIKKKANLEIQEKNEELNSQNEEILAQRDQLEEQNQVIGEKNRQITDSINYAERIQQAMLPSEEKLKALFPDNFVLFKPRDIVSGDFFWAGETDSHKIIVVADCTGHGVPGAFMSMIGMELLNRIISLEGNSDPGLILNKLHVGVNEALKQDKTEVRDGMDIVVLAEAKKKSEILFAGAKNSLVYAENGTIETIKGDKFPIGGHSEEGERKFTSHKITPKSGAFFYLFSDGIQDQFGGPDGKKFMVKRLKKILASNHSLPPRDQLAALTNSLDDWMKGEEQLDDICLIGLRV